MKYVLTSFLIVASGVAVAKNPVSIGRGQYMMSDRNITVFGSADGIITKLMTKANSFCHERTGGEAELLESGGSNAVPGELENGRLRRAAQGATGTIYFRCSGDSQEAKAANGAAGGRFFQLREFGTVSAQVTMPTDEDCKVLAQSISGSSCASTTTSDPLPIRAILENSSKEILVVDAVGSMACDGIVSGMTSSGLAVVKDCAYK